MAARFERLHFAGTLAVDRYPEFRTAFEQAPADRPVLVDVRDATAVDPTFLAELLMFQRRRRPQPVVVLVAPGSEVARTFGLPALKDKIAVADDEPRAVRDLMQVGRNADARAGDPSGG